MAFVSPLHIVVVGSYSIGGALLGDILGGATSTGMVGVSIDLTDGLVVGVVGSVIAGLGVVCDCVSACGVRARTVFMGAASRVCVGVAVP